MRLDLSLSENQNDVGPNLQQLSSLHFLSTHHMGDTTLDDADNTPPTSADTNEETPDISKANIFKFKKRVQFLPDDDLVRVREIPPRSNRSSFEESDNDQSDSSSDSDKFSDSEESSTETEESSDSDSDTSSSKQGSEKTTATWTHSTVAPSNTPGLRPRVGSLTSSATAKVNRSPTIPSSTTPFQKTRATLKLDTATRREKRDDVGDTLTLDLKTVTKSRASLVKSLHKQDINVSSPPQPKNSKLYPSFKPPCVNTRSPLNRRAQSAPQNKHTSTKRNLAISVTTSLNTVPSALQAQIDVIKQSMQTVTIGQLYTMDGFIFPSHQVADPRLPTILPSKVTNMVSRASSSSDRNGGLDSSLTAHKVHENAGTVSTVKLGRNENHHQSSYGGKRYYAWQMANGSPQGTLQNTPNIAQLWEDASMTSPVAPLHDSVSDSK